MLTTLEQEVAQLLVSTLHLEDDPAEIAPEEPLFVEGLGLDSIDALEIALAVSQAYGVEIKSDDTDNRRIFASLRALTGHIDKHRVR
jgi:acyl carrier protein